MNQKKRLCCLLIILSLFLGISACKNQNENSNVVTEQPSIISEAEQTTRPPEAEGSDLLNEAEEKAKFTQPSLKDNTISEEAENSSEEEKSATKSGDPSISKPTRSAENISSGKQLAGPSDTSSKQGPGVLTTSKNLSEEGKKTEPTEIKTKATSGTKEETAAPTPPVIVPTTAETVPPTTKPTEPAEIQVYLSVDCSAAVEAGDSVAIAVSDNGTIMSGQLFTLQNGATVYDLILNSGLVVNATGGYISAIQSLSEFGVKGKGGWYYYVNGVKPGFGAMQYVLQAGDQVLFSYTLDY